MWPQLTNIEKEISATIKSRANTKVASKLNPWVRIISGAEVSGVKGLVITSNNDFKLFKAADQNFGAIYGSKAESGAIGYDLANKNAIGASGEGRGFRPSPIIKSLTSKEGKDQISRELELTLECFSKDQMELLQSFLMEPGYNLCVEWGFNTANALSQMIDTQKSLEEILNSVANRCLNQDNIHKARKNSAGEYDIFLGFIVGGNVTSQGENFELTIKCKGAPGLPTFLQTHKKTQELDANGKVIELPTVHPFPVSELEEEGSAATAAVSSGIAAALGGTASNYLSRRRFKAMFNALPAEKQIKEIKELSPTEYSEYDFINFDEVVNQTLLDYESVGWFDASDIRVGNATLAKESLFNNDRYISMGLCAKLLNLNGGLNTIKLRDKDIKVKIDISNSIIGAFPHMFSTKPDKLIIPGSALPPFKKYFLSSVEVQQQANGSLSDEGPIDYSTGDKKFPETTDLNSSGHKESANYWGYLRNLFVNFDQVFYPKITQTNKTIREIFLDILNELSSAVNSFWNFQIVETTVTKDKPVEGLSEGDIVITIIDENWVGKNANPEPPTKFIHAGIESAFLSADLDISIPQDMTSMLVAKRLSLATNPDSAIVNTGELFNSSVDLFMNKVTLQGTGTESNNAEQETEMTAVEKVTKEYEDLEKQQTSLKTKNAELKAEIRRIEDAYIKAGANNLTVREVGGFIASIFTDDEADAARERDLARRRALEAEKDAKIKPLEDEIDANDKIISDLRTKINEKYFEKLEAEKKAIEDAKAAEQAAMTKNFEKISIVANPSRGAIEIDTDRIKSSTVFDKTGELRIYTLNDGNYFDRLRNDAFSSQGTGNNTRLSHPLPIKYNFKTIGISGLRRGDTFNILGIPDKYAAHGLFQITQVEHELSGMEWHTSVTGEYRQQNS